MLSKSVAVGRAFNLAMTADDVLVALALAEQGKADGVARRACEDADRLLEDMEAGLNLCTLGHFNAAPDSVRQVELYHYYARPALREAGIIQQANQLPFDTFAQIREPLQSIRDHGSVQSLDLAPARAFFRALACNSSEEIGEIMAQPPWPSRARERVGIDER